MSTHGWAEAQALPTLLYSLWNASGRGSGESQGVARLGTGLGTARLGTARLGVREVTGLHDTVLCGDLAPSTQPGSPQPPDHYGTLA